MVYNEWKIHEKKWMMTPGVPPFMESSNWQFLPWEKWGCEPLPLQQDLVLRKNTWKRRVLRMSELPKLWASEEVLQSKNETEGEMNLYTENGAL